MDKFCIYCGTELINNECPKCISAKTTQTTNNSNYQQFFSNPQEKYITSLGSKYIANYLTYGTLNKGFIVASDKRVYAHGHCFDVITNNKGKRRIRKSYKSRTIDIKDITGTGVDSFSEPLWLVYAILSIIVTVLSFFSLLYMFNKSNHMGMNIIDPLHFIFILLLLLGAGLHVFFIFKWFQSQIECVIVQYAGGEFALNLQWFSNKELEDFQRLLRITKDKFYQKAEPENVPVASISKSSVADEILKYNELLSAGIITQEEFNKMKQKVIDNG